VALALVQHGCLGARVLQAGSEGARSVALPVDETPRSRRLHRLLGLIRSGGHLRRGGYGVQHGRGEEAA
jgi:hypothetical protein